MVHPDIALAIAILFFFGGFIGSFFPVVPGTLIVWLGVLIHKILLGPESVSWTFFWFATAMTIAAQVIDLALGYWGARRFGASWQGAVGGIVGGIVGLLFLNIPGLFIGSIAGVMAVEIARRKTLREAGRASVGMIIGGILGFAAKLGLAFVIIAGFFISLYWN